MDRLFGEDIAFEEDIRFLGIVATLIVQFVSLNLQVRAREEHLRQENLSLRVELSEESHDLVIVGKSPAILEVQQLLKKVAPVRAPVLLMGESGTGKTLIARVIHELSPRARYPFLKINCASLPENLLEIELFGYEKGASPGRSRPSPAAWKKRTAAPCSWRKSGSCPSPSRPGWCASSRNGNSSAWAAAEPERWTSASSPTPARIWPAGQVGRLPGGSLLSVASFPSGCRPSGSGGRTSRPLLDHFLDKVSKEYGRRFYLTQKALEVLQDYAWPGNVREMENLVERLCIVVEGLEIDVKDLPSYLSPAGAKADARGPGLSLPS